MSQLPTINKPTQAPVQNVAKPSKPKQERPVVVIVTVELPVMDQIFEGYFSNRVDLKLTTAQQSTLKSLLFGLQSKFAKLDNGKDVANAADAIKWILENAK